MISLVVSLGLLFPQDTVFKEAAIDEVVVSATVGASQKAVSKGRVASIDEHLGRLSKVEMVMVSIVFACQQFFHYLLPRPFVFLTSYNFVASSYQW